MISKAAVLLCVVACALGDGPHAISEQKVVLHISPEHHGHHGELAHIGEHKPEHHEQYAWAYPSYEFAYRVEDPHTHDFKGQKEERKGDEVKGEYWLLQPDGYTRIVKYHSDKHTGFKADVKYEKTHEPMHHEPKHHVPHKPHVEHHVHIEHKEEKHVPVHEEKREEWKEEKPQEPEIRHEPEQPKEIHHMPVHKPEPKKHHRPAVIENYRVEVHHPMHKPVHEEHHEERHHEPKHHEPKHHERVEHWPKKEGMEEHWEKELLRPHHEPHHHVAHHVAHAPHHHVPEHHVPLIREPYHGHRRHVRQNGAQRRAAEENEQ